MDDPSQLADQYQNQVVWDGLGLVDFSIVPHYDSDHTESYLAALTVSFIVNLLISTFGRDSTIPVVVNTSP